MKALVFQRPKRVRVETVPDPRIENARDVVIRVTAASIGGADLHVYNGYLPADGARVLGREFMGVVEEAGPRVAKLKRGDRVVVPFPVACGECWFCLRGLTAHCERASDPRALWPGGQAQFARVPFADAGPRKVPPELSDEDALFLGDVIPAGWTAAEWCGIKGGETVAVFGCGPVGLMALKAARLQGAARLIAVDVLPYRRAIARRLAGAEIVDPQAVDPAEAIRELTGGRGADACIDAVGLEADHTVLEAVSNVIQRQVGTIKALRTVLRSVRRGGAVSVVGAYRGPHSDFPLGQIFEKGLRLRAGPAPVHACIDKLLCLAADGKLSGADLVTHRMPLDEGPRAYEIFNDKLEDCLKIVLNPWQHAPAREELSVEQEELGLEPETLSETLFDRDD